MLSAPVLRPPARVRVMESTSAPELIELQAVPPPGSRRTLAMVWDFEENTYTLIKTPRSCSDHSDLPDAEVTPLSEMEIANVEMVFDIEEEHKKRVQELVSVYDRVCSSLPIAAMYIQRCVYGGLLMKHPRFSTIICCSCGTTIVSTELDKGFACGTHVFHNFHFDVSGFRDRTLTDKFVCGHNVFAQCGTCLWKTLGRVKFIKCFWCNFEPCDA